MNRIVCFLMVLMLTPGLALAEKGKRFITVPQCLLSHVNATHYQVIEKNKGILLISVDSEGIDELILAKTQEKTLCGGFKDVTKAYHSQKFSKQYFLTDHATHKTQKKETFEIKHAKEVNALSQQLNPGLMWDNLSELTQFQDRYADSKHGVEAAEWFKAKVESIAKENQRTDVSVELIETTDYRQPSVVVKVGASENPAVVVGAHMDTLSGRYSHKPGADDDGSGSVTVLEIVRTILASGQKFENPLYFMWYAAEEEGLLGSQEVVAYFNSLHIPVKAVLHFDMTGYAYKNDQTLHLLTDHVSKDLTDYLAQLIATYVKKPVAYTQCGYACSDHASWTAEGYSAAMPFEASFNHDNPDIHSSQDTMDKLSLDHMTDFLKLGLAFAVELANPVS